MQCAGRPFLSFVKHLYKVAAFIHVSLEPLEALPEYTIKLAPLCPPPLLLSQLAFGGPSYLSFLNIGFQPKQKMARLLHRGFNVSILDVLTRDLGRPPRGGLCPVSMSNTGRDNNFGTTDFLLPFHDKTMKWWCTTNVSIYFFLSHLKTKGQNYDMIICYNMMIW